MFYVVSYRVNVFVAGALLGGMLSVLTVLVMHA
jgi:hypothetical protein